MDGIEVTYLDTHVLVRLYLGQIAELGAAARATIEKDDLLVSAAAIVELEYLHEIGRLRPTAAKLIHSLEQDVDLHVCDLPFRIVGEHALAEKWTRDPFDRFIVANAKARQSKLITKDEKIHRHFDGAIW